ncbi:hypothetical protein D9M68_788740 [compost metagenome]
MEGFGEFLFRDLQLLLGGLELADVTHDHHQGRGVGQLEGLGGDQSGEELAVMSAKGHFQVAQAFALQAFQQGRADAGDAPDVQFGRRFAECFADRDAGLLFEGVVGLEQATVRAAGNHQDVRALLEYRGEFLLGEAQGLLGLLGLADVDHQSAHDYFIAVPGQGDDVANPQHMAVCGEHPVVQAVIAACGAFALAVVDGLLRVVRVHGTQPETGAFPLRQGVAQ